MLPDSESGLKQDSARRRNSSIIFVSTIPPPLGGISVHVVRLIQRATAAGWPTELLDLRPQKGKRIPEGCISRPAAHGLVSIVRYWILLATRHDHIFHYHAARLAIFIAANLPVLMFRARFCGIVTFHSGDLPREIADSGPIARRLLRAILMRYQTVIAVGPRMAESLSEFLAPGVSPEVIPAFLPTADSLVREPAGHVEVICSGYGTPLYNWEAVAIAAETCPTTWIWTCCFYTKFDQPYYSAIRERLTSLSNVNCFENLSPEEFQTKVASSTVFLRPTWADGDAVSLREALACGLRCVASDVVPRPDGVLVYPAAEVEQLIRTIRLAVEMGPGRTVQSPDFGMKIMAIYDSVQSKGDALRS